MIRKRYNYTNKTEIPGKIRYLMPCYGNRDIYNFYRKNVKKRIKSKYNIKFKQHRDILDTYNKKLVELLIQGYEIKIPSLGFIQVRKKFITNENYNSKAQVKIFADGKWQPKIVYKRNSVKLRNVMYYSFKGGTDLTRRLLAIFKTNDGHKRYFEK